MAEILKKLNSHKCDEMEEFSKITMKLYEDFKNLAEIGKESR